MADSDSFISEVSEEVRRDRLFAFFRRWAWAFILAVLIIVGTAAFFEWRNFQERQAAEAFGDAVIEALDAADTGARIAALRDVPAETPGAEMLQALLIAGQETEAGEAEAAAERLRTISARTDMPERYRDLAALKAHLLDPRDDADAMATLDRLSRPGAPYRGLAVEQQAYLMVANGDREGGIALLQEILSEEGTTPGLQQRVGRLIVALEAGAELTDAPLPEAAAPDLPTGLPVGEPVEDAAPGTDAAEDTAEGAADETDGADEAEDDAGAPAE